MNVARLLAGFLGWALAAAAWAQREPAGLASAAAEILGRVEDARQIAPAGDELAALGPGALPVLFGWLAAGAVSRPEAAPLELDVRRRTALLSALGALPRAGVLEFVTALARKPGTETERVAALDLLARMGGKEELKLALELGAPGDPSAPPPAELRGALGTALTAITSRDSGAARLLAGFFSRAQPYAQVSIARVLAAPCSEESLRLLASLLGSSPGGADTVLLLAIEGAAGRGASTQDLEVLQRVRGYLGHPNQRLGALACLAVEKLRDHEAVPDLIVLLDDGDASMPARAHAALVSLTGLAFTADPQPWLTWLDQELAWWDERAEPCRVALSSGSPAEAAAAIQEVAHQRLFLERVAQLLDLGLAREEPDLVESAAIALVAVDPARAHGRLAGTDSSPVQLSPRVQASLRRHQATAGTRPVRRPINDRIEE